MSFLPTNYVHPFCILPVWAYVLPKWAWKCCLGLYIMIDFSGLSKTWNLRSESLNESSVPLQDKVDGGEDWLGQGRDTDFRWEPQVCWLESLFVGLTGENCGKRRTAGMCVWPHIFLHYTTNFYVNRGWDCFIHWKRGWLSDQFIYLDGFFPICAYADNLEYVPNLSILHSHCLL